MRWDLWCRVIDNWGDVGVCWRLAADLAARGEQVRLWIDDPSPLAWMAPGGCAGVEVRRWNADADAAEPGDVVVEAFACDPPAAFVARMAARERSPVWINLEYLSAEPYVDASHGLPSPQQLGPGRGLTKWFFFPGFGERSGGLLREAGLMQRRDAFDATAWLASHGLQRRVRERVVTLFCYDNTALDGLLDTLSSEPTLLLVASGAATRQVHDRLGRELRRHRLRAQLLPLLTQTAFDEALWAADLSFVRGEDSFVRAMWAGAPFAWQAYPQQDRAHAHKVDAFLDRLLERGTPAGGAIRSLWRRWNGLEAGPIELPQQAPWREATLAWRQRLLSQEDLTGRLLRFVDSKR